MLLPIFCIFTYIIVSVVCFRSSIVSSLQSSLQMATFAPTSTYLLPVIEGIPLSEDALIPSWFEALKGKTNTKIVAVAEWQDEDWRNQEGGFQGRDFCHSKHSSVRILDYVIVAPTDSDSEVVEANANEFPKIIGPAYFSQKCESHRGLCHGGSFCALMDDAIGWMGFCVSGNVKPWTGFTVQINTSLKKAVKVGSTLKLEAWVNRKEGARKYWIGSRLSNSETGDVHCEAEGLFLLSPDEVEQMAAF